MVKTFGSSGSSIARRDFASSAENRFVQSSLLRLEAVAVELFRHFARLATLEKIRDTAAAKNQFSRL